MSSTHVVIGLTGGIGSGKSVVASMLQLLGCIVADADTNAKQALQDEDIKTQLVAWWGESILDEQGNINKSELSTIVFEDREQLQRLETLLHPRARALQDQQFAQATAETTALVIDAPLLMETGLDAMCDFIIFVDASKEIRLDRVQKNRDWDANELVRREASQIPLDNKREKADYIVVNEGEPSEVQHQVEQTLEDIRKRQL